MNTVVIMVLYLTWFIIGFIVGACACTTKINRLEVENSTLKEWLEASRTTNKTLLREIDELRLDLESSVNGVGIVTHKDYTKTE